jgi:DNA-binding transcriptional ArsR family regulator
VSTSAQSLLRPLRARILEEAGSPTTAAGIARKLSIARQKVGYHLRLLEKEGLVELVEERKQGNCVERIVRATARAYLVSAEALGALAQDAAGVQDKVSAAYLVAVAAQSAREVAQLRQKADAAGQRLATLTLQSEVQFATAKDRGAFADELANAIAGLIAKYHQPEAPKGRTYRLTTFAYPKPAPAPAESPQEPES